MKESNIDYDYEIEKMYHPENFEPLPVEEQRALRRGKKSKVCKFNGDGIHKYKFIIKNEYKFSNWHTAINYYRCACGKKKYERCDEK